ncbi:MAG: DoxX family membrane protein [Propioniciclava sp.]
MNLVRGIGRLLLGSFYISTGVRAVRNPAEYAEAAQSLTDRLTPLAQRILPEDAVAMIPEDATTVVRAIGIASVMGGAGMALGLGTRPAASLAAFSMVPTLLAGTTRGSSGAEKELRRSLSLRNLALFGAALVVSQDTKGQPSVLWRVRDSRVRLAQQAEHTRKSLAREASRTSQLVGKDLRRIKRDANRRAQRARKSIEA